MSIIKTVQWKCDFCSHRAKPGNKDWLVVADFYGNEVHCCMSRDCQVLMNRFADDSGLKVRK
jgi:hypothetical protein